MQLKTEGNCWRFTGCVCRWLHILEGFMVTYDHQAIPFALAHFTALRKSSLLFLAWQEGRTKQISYIFSLRKFPERSHSQSYKRNNSAFFLGFSPLVRPFRRKFKVTKSTRIVDFVSLKCSFHKTNLLSLAHLGTILILGSLTDYL